MSEYKIRYSIMPKSDRSVDEGWVPPDGVTWEAFLEEKAKLIAKQQEEKKARCKAEGLPYSRYGNYSHVK